MTSLSPGAGDRLGKLRSGSPLTRLVTVAVSLAEVASRLRAREPTRPRGPGTSSACGTGPSRSSVPLSVVCSNIQYSFRQTHSSKRTQ